MTDILRIALYDEKLFQTLRKFDFSDVQFELLQEPGAECAAHILILDDVGIRRAAARCTSASRPSFFVCVEEGKPVPSTYVEGLADDLLVTPIRRLDVLRLIRLHHQMQGLREIENTSKAIPALVNKLQEDLQLAQKIQRRLIKDKFPAISGLKIKSKYWCGMKSGGDYFDIFEFPDGNNVGFLLTDSSSYSLSTSFLGSLMQFTLHLGAHDAAEPAKIVESLYAKIREGMKEKDEFSILYGVLDRKTYALKTVSCGKLYALHEAANNFNWIANGATAPLTKNNGVIPQARETLLDPSDRLMLLSDGWRNGANEPLEKFAERLLESNRDAQDLVNEFSFSLRQSIEREQEESTSAEDEFPMPPEDCSILVIEVAKNILRLAKQT